MKNNIYNFALRSNEINVNALCEMCDMMDDGMRDRFVNAVLGIADYTEPLPETSHVYDRDCRIISSNYLANIVEYEYDKKVTRYYKTDEEADRFTKEGRGRWDGSDRQSNDYPFMAVHTFRENGSCSFHDWKNGNK